jgi:hypothetical protein
MGREGLMTENHLPAAIADFIEATNRGDSDAFVAAFTQDAYLTDWGRDFHGHDGVRAWNRTDNIGVAFRARQRRARRHARQLRRHPDGDRRRLQRDRAAELRATRRADRGPTDQLTDPGSCPARTGRLAVPGTTRTLARPHAAHLGAVAGRPRTGERCSNSSPATRFEYAR